MLDHREFLITLAERGSLKPDKTSYEFTYCWYQVSNCDTCDLKSDCKRLFSTSLPHIKFGSDIIKEMEKIIPEFFL